MYFSCFFVIVHPVYPSIKEEKNVGVLIFFLQSFVVRRSTEKEPNTHSGGWSFGGGKGKVQGGVWGFVCLFFEII